MTTYMNDKRETVVVPDGASGDVASALRAIADAKGMKEVVDAAPRPALSPFMHYVQRIVPEYGDDGDLVRYRRTWKGTAVPVHLSQAKVLANPVVAAKIADRVSELSANKGLVDWWTGNMTYVRGSDTAALAMEALGLTQNEIEQVALACRG